MKKNNLITIILSLILMITIIFGLFPSNTFAATQKRDSQISNIDNKKYPGIKTMIASLQKKYPKWNFKVLYTGLDWNTVITQESKHGRNLIPKSYSSSWVCSKCGDKGYSGSNWLCASSTAIAYMMDPRNSLYYEDVFQFLELSYDSNTKYDSSIIKSILKNTFLDDGNLDKYVSTILSSSKEKNVNPYYIAGKIIQEQGKKGGSTFKMSATEDDKTVYYYNIFNINACGTTTSDIIKNALIWAKAKGWNTIEKCISGGVEFIANGYITKGQDTMYLEKFDVIADEYYTHQYAQDVMYAQNQGEKLRRILESIDATEYAYTFVIPVYENMPSSACPRPGATNNDTENNTTNYLENNSESNYVKGDASGDGKITASDYVLIKNHIMGTKLLSDEAKKYADYNEDGKVTASDYVLIKNYIMSK